MCYLLVLTVLVIVCSNFNHSMSVRQENLYNRFNVLDELWEKKDEEKMEQKKKTEKKAKLFFEDCSISRNTKKKTESNDLKSAAFCAPRIQKKKNSRSAKGQKQGRR